MDNAVIDFLEGMVTEPVLGDYIDAYTLMARLNSNAALEEATMVLQGECYSGEERLRDAICQITLVGLDSILTQYGVFFMPYNLNTSLVKRTEMLECLIAIENYESSAVIINACEQSTDPLMTLMDIISTITRFDMFYFVDDLLKVNSLFIDRIREHHLQREEVMDKQPVEYDPNVIKAIKQYANKFSTSLITTDLKGNKIRPCTDINTLVNMYRPELIACEPVSVDAAAVNVLGLALLADAELLKYQETCTIICNKVYIEPDFIARVIAKISEIALGVV